MAEEDATLGAFVEDVVKSYGGVAKPETFVEFVEAFFTAVHWKDEVWIWILVAMHTILFLLAIGTRNIWQMQLWILCVVGAFVLCAEWINTYAHENWKQFSGQNYFDPQGVFISLVWSMPLLVIAFSILVFGVCNASSLLIVVKKEQLKREKDDKKKKKKEKKH